jgi:hypothetical protein
MKGSIDSWARHGVLLTMITMLGACDRDPLVHQDDAATRKLYEKKAKAWTRWALEQPWSNGPINDTDGSACASEQQGNTWFLAGTAGGAVERECTIPAGKAMFFPLVNYWLSPSAATYEMYPEQEWVDYAIELFTEQRAATCALTLRIDGEDLLPDLETMDEELYVEILEPFTVELGADSWSSPYGGLPGPRETFINGHWALIEPLPPGDYTLELGGELCYPDDEGFSTAVTYTLHVEG